MGSITRRRGRLYPKFTREGAKGIQGMRYMDLASLESVEKGITLRHGVTKNRIHFESVYIFIQGAFMITAKQEAGTQETKIPENEIVDGCIYGDNCPLLSDNPPFNAVTLAAMQEAEDMINGKKPCTWYGSPEDLIDALKKI